MVFFAGKSKKKVEVKAKPKTKVENVVVAEDIITESDFQVIDSVVCDRCGNDMSLFRENGHVKDYVCHFCGKKLTTQ